MLSAFLNCLTICLTLCNVLRGKERCLCHGLFNTFHLVGLITDHASCDRVVTLLNTILACHSYIEHGSIIRAVALLLRLMQSVRNGIQLLCLASTMLFVVTSRHHRFLSTNVVLQKRALKSIHMMRVRSTQIVLIPTGLLLDMYNNIDTYIIRWRHQVHRLIVLLSR